MLDAQSLDKYRSYASRYEKVSDKIKNLKDKKEVVDREIVKITEEYERRIHEVMGPKFTRAVRVIELQEEQAQKIHEVLQSVDVSNPEAISNEEFSAMLEEPEVLEEVERAIEELKRSLDQQKKFNLAEHRWSAGRTPFLEALQRGSYIVEKDFRSTRDGDVISSHSLRLGKSREKGGGFMSNLFGKAISHSTVEELRELDEDVLTLGQAFDDFEPYAEQHMFMLDIKDALVVDVLLKILKSRKDGKKLSKRLIIASNLAIVIRKLLSQKDFEFGGFNMGGNPITGNPVAFASLSERPGQGVLRKFMTNLKKDSLRSEYRASIDKPSWKSPRRVVSLGSEGGEENEVNDILAIEGDGRETVGNVFISVPRRFLKELSQKNGSLELIRALIKSNLLAGISVKRAQEGLTEDMQKSGKYGLKVMFVTLGERGLGGRIKGFSAENQVRRILKASQDSGVGVIIYTEDPVGIAKKISDSE